MVKGKGKNWEQLSGRIMQILGLLDVYVSLLGLPVYFLFSWRGGLQTTSLFYTTPESTTLNALRQCALNILFVSPAPAPNDALDGPAVPVHNPFPFIHMRKNSSTTASLYPQSGTIGERS